MKDSGFINVEATPSGLHTFVHFACRDRALSLYNRKCWLRIHESPHVRIRFYRLENRKQGISDRVPLFICVFVSVLYDAKFLVSFANIWKHSWIPFRDLFSLFRLRTRLRTTLLGRMTNAKDANAYLWEEGRTVTSLHPHWYLELAALAIFVFCSLQIVALCCRAEIFFFGYRGVYEESGRRRNLLS